MNNNGQPWTVARLQAYAESQHRERVRSLAATIRDDFLEDLESLYLSHAAWQKTYPGVVDRNFLMQELEQIFPDLRILVLPDYPSSSMNVMICLWPVMPIEND